MTKRAPYSVQAPTSVVMVRPHRFSVNTETAADNRFQDLGGADDGLSRSAHDEITRAAATLEGHGIKVHLFEDEGNETPDSVFPNNWFSTHSGGYVAIYPMKPVSRRRERRTDILEMLKQRYRVQEIIDYSGLEQDCLFLEGTGAMVLDHIDRIAYAVRSDRTNPIPLERFCTDFGFEPMVFDAEDESGAPIYHTNVLLCVATEFAMIGLDMLKSRARRDEIVERLVQSGRRVIGLTNEQVASFAGNALELRSTDKRVLALSATAYHSLTDHQKEAISESAEIVALDIPTIERAGGSVRCTLAGIHLAPRG